MWCPVGNGGRKAGLGVAAIVAGLACLGTAAGPAGAVSAAQGADPAAPWGKAIKVPGLATLNTGFGGAEVLSVSCGSAGSCAAGGYYNAPASQPGFVVSERNGRWGKAIEVPGVAAVRAGGLAQVNSVSCASAGNCAAGGYYTDSTGRNLQGFVIAERDGRWSNAIEVPGLGTLNAGKKVAVVQSVSCASPGNCAAAGNYTDRSGHTQEFVATERNSRWGNAIEVPGLGTLNAGGDAEDISVSCASAGNCAVGGDYVDKPGNLKGFVVSERNGHWGNAIEVPGLAALNTGGFGEVGSVSCGSAGNCAAGGFYTDRSGHVQGFVVSEQNGRWGNATEIPGLRTLNTGGDAEVGPMSCPLAGYCAAGGGYTAGHRRGQGFVAVERNGRWGNAIEVPGLGTLNTGGDAAVFSVSCASPGNCAAGGDYAPSRQLRQGFVVTEQHGRWGRAIEVHGLTALNKGGNAAIVSVSCAPAGNCAAGGYYEDHSFERQGFLASRPK